jgi:hypothetical protein
MTRVSRVVGCLCLALVFAACGEDLFDMNKMGGGEQDEGSNSGGGDGDGPTGNIEGPRSGVNGDDSVADLSDDDATKLCTWAAGVVAKFQPTPEQACTFAAAATGDAAQCQEATAQCQEQLGDGQAPPVMAEGPAAEDIQGCTEDVSAALNSGCGITVADLEACLNDTLALINQVFSSISCDNLDVLAKPPEEPASCKVIDDKCPELAPEGDDGGMFGPGSDEPGENLPPGASGDEPPPPDGSDLPPDDDRPPPPEGACIDGTPLPLDSFCDGKVDCTEGEDEKYCGSEPPPPAPRVALEALRARLSR